MANKRLASKDIYANIDWEKVSQIFKNSTPEVSKSKFPPVKNILHVLAAVGAVGLIFAFPGPAIGIGALTLGDTSYDRWRSKKIFYQMAKQKYITIK